MSIVVAVLAGFVAGAIYGAIRTMQKRKEWHTCPPCPVCEMLRDISERKAKPWPDGYRFRDRHYWE